MDQRRRRVVLEEVTQAVRQGSGLTQSLERSDSASISSEPNPKVYSNSAHRRHQKKTTDLIPKRYRSVALFVALLVICLCGLNALSIYSKDWQDLFSASQMQAFSLSGHGSLAGWFTSFLFVLSGLASLQIYALRQHRCDDYRGTYRLWGWVAALFMLGSIQCVVDVVGLSHSVANSLLGAASGSGLVWLVTAKLLVLSILIVRGLFEVRNSVSAFAYLLVAWIAYTSAVVLQIPSVQENLVLEYQPYYGNCLLVGTSALFMAVVQYARFVFLHANGLLEIRTKKQVLNTDTAAKSASLKTGNGTSSSSSKSEPISAKESLSKKDHGDKKVVVAKKPLPEPTPKPISKPTPKQTSKPTTKSSKATSPLGSRIKSKPAPTSDFSLDLDDDEMEIFTLTEKSQLSKSERRRLRKLQKRQKRAA